MLPGSCYQTTSEIAVTLHFKCSLTVSIFASDLHRYMNCYKKDTLLRASIHHIVLKSLYFLQQRHAPYILCTQSSRATSRLSDNNISLITSMDLVLIWTSSCAKPANSTHRTRIEVVIPVQLYQYSLYVLPLINVIEADIYILLWIVSIKSQ